MKEGKKKKALHIEEHYGNSNFYEFEGASNKLKKHKHKNIYSYYNSEFPFINSDNGSKINTDNNKSYTNNGNYFNLSLDQKILLVKENKKNMIDMHIQLTKSNFFQKQRNLNENKKQMEIEKMQKMEEANKRDQMRKLKLKVHRLIHSNCEICHDLNAKSISFKRKLIEYFSSAHYLKTQANYNLNFHFEKGEHFDFHRNLFLIEEKRELYHTKPKIMKNFNAQFTEEEKKLILSDPTYYFKDIKKLTQAKAFIPTTLTEKFNQEEKEEEGEIRRIQSISLKKRKYLPGSNERKQTLETISSAKYSRNKTQPFVFNSNSNKAPKTFTEHMKGEIEFEKAQNVLKKAIQKAKNSLFEKQKKKYIIKMNLNKQFNDLQFKLDNITKIKNRYRIIDKDRKLPQKEKRDNLIKNNFERLNYFTTYIKNLENKDLNNKNNGPFKRECKKNHFNKQKQKMSENQLLRLFKATAQVNYSSNQTTNSN